MDKSIRKSIARAKELSERARKLTADQAPKNLKATISGVNGNDKKKAKKKVVKKKKATKKKVVKKKVVLTKKVRKKELALDRKYSKKK